MDKGIKTQHSLYIGDAVSVLQELPDKSVHCCVTSPPYWGLRDYGVPGQIGFEPTPDEYVAKMVEVFREVRRALRDDGTLWLNLGDSYAGSGKGPEGGVNKGMEHRHLENKVKPFKSEFIKPKDLVGIPWRVAFALRDDGWWLRSDIIWAKPNPMPESVTDRPTRSHEYIFLLTKSERYFYDHVAIQEKSVTGDLRRPYGSEGAWQLDGRPQEQRHGDEPRRFYPATDPMRVTSKPDAVGKNTYTGFNDRYKPLSMRNKRDVWTVATQPFPGAHFAVFPEALVEPCILAGTSEKGCCPKCGAPWVRITEKRVADVTRPRPFSKLVNVDRNDVGNIYRTVSHTIRWEPTCSCELTPIPCTVLDPFGGSGTVSVVARNLFRNSIYVDISKKYCEMAQRRIGDSLFCKVIRMD